MQYHWILTDRQLEINFEHGLLHPRFFTHETHLRLAWIHIRKYGVAQAMLNLCDQISRFDQVSGTGMKYSPSLTITAVKLIGMEMEKFNCSDFKEFISRSPELMYNFKALIDRMNALETEPVMSA